MNFKKRYFVSSFMALTFFVSTVTGIIMYIIPACRISNQNNWNFLCLNRYGCGSLHTIFSFAFVITAVIHLFVYNLRAFLSCLSEKTAVKNEFLLALAVTLVTAAGAIFQIPPFKNVIEMGSYFKQLWAK